MTAQVGMNQLLNCFAGPSSPSSPESGQLWYDTGSSALKVYNGSTWASVGGGGGGLTGGTWQDLTASRAFDVVYQNTTGSSIQVSITVYGGDYSQTHLLVDTVNPPTVTIADTYQVGAAVRSQIAAIIPPNNYYQLTYYSQPGSGEEITRWAELR